MAGESSRTAHLVAIDLGEDQILIEELCLNDHVTTRSNNLRAAPEVYAILEANAIAEDNVRAEQSCIRPVLDRKSVV